MVEEQILTVPGKFGEIQRICRFVADGARDVGMDPDAIFHIELCCDEAATNIIEHSYGGEGKGDITVSYELEADSFIITLHDSGKPFNPEDIPEPKVYKSDDTKQNAMGDIIDSLQVGGLGIHFMRKLMDEVNYRFEGSHGNTLILVKYIDSRDDS